MRGYIPKIESLKLILRNEGGLVGKCEIINTFVGCWKEEDKIMPVRYMEHVETTKNYFTGSLQYIDYNSLIFIYFV